MKSSISIIILNWNTWEDTIECIESVLGSNYENFIIYLLDNNSTNDSLEKIDLWSRGLLREKIGENRLKIKDINYCKKLNTVIKIKYPSDEKEYKKIVCAEKKAIVLIQNIENEGFAIGNNRVINLIFRYNPSDYILLLNNDTVINRDAISELINVIEKDSELGVVSPIFYHYYNPDVIDHAGGILTFLGKHKYVNKITPGEILPVTFISGCSVLIRTSVIEKYGMFSENFFFGEEDIEFSYRMKRYGVKMKSVTKSKVYHKIGSSAENFFQANLKRGFIHRLSRLINMKDYYSSFHWYIWKYISLFYFFFDYPRRYDISYKKSFSLVVKQNYYSKNFKDVKKDKVEYLMDKI